MQRRCQPRHCCCGRHAQRTLQPHVNVKTEKTVNTRSSPAVTAHCSMLIIVRCPYCKLRFFSLREGSRAVLGQIQESHKYV